MPMGMADVATVLFEKHLKFDAAAPDWPDRDRFILSAGPWLDAALFAAAPDRL
jgi:transketolase